MISGFGALRLEFLQGVTLLHLTLLQRLTFGGSWLFALLGQGLATYLLVAFWSAVGTGHDQPLTLAYLVASRFLYKALDFRLVLKLADAMQSGDIVMDLVRPVDFLRSWMYRGWGVFLCNLISYLPLLLPLGFLHFDLQVQQLWFLLSLLLSVTVMLLLEMLFGCLVMALRQGYGAKLTYDAIGLLLTGTLIPPMFTPPWLQGWIALSPQGHAVYLPLHALLANETPWIDVLLGQTCWVLVLWLLLHWALQQTLGKLSVGGG